MKRKYSNIVFYSYIGLIFLIGVFFIIFLKVKNYSNSYRYIEVCIRYDLIYGRLWNKIDEIQCKCNLNKDTAFITMFIKTKQGGDI